MLPTFVIGLREGLEAALIVGIIAAFLRKQGRRDLVRWVFVGIGTAVLLCVAVGVGLDVLSQNLPQREQEGLETVIGALAVGMVTYMVVWMRRHSRELKGQLEGMAASALHGTSRATHAMIVMAFLAVLREGFETVVFLLAAFNEAHSGPSAAVGAVLGIVVAIALGYGIYRGGVRLNLSKFFRATGLVLVLVAAGLVVNALRTAHEAGWLNVGQGGTVDLTWLVEPGSVQASLLTGMLGIQARPTVIELIGWLAYLIPVGLYVAWPPGRGLPKRATARALAAGGLLAAVAALALVLVRPDRPGTPAATSGGGVAAQLLSRSGEDATVLVSGSPASGRLQLQRAGTAVRAGVATDLYAATVPGTPDGTLPAALGADRIAQLNGGRLPIGLAMTSAESRPASYAARVAVQVWVEPRTGRVVDVRESERVTASVTGTNGALFPLATPVATGQAALPAAAVDRAADRAHAELARLDDRAALQAAAWGTGAAAVALLAAAAALAVQDGRERRTVPVPVGEPVVTGTTG